MQPDITLRTTPHEHISAYERVKRESVHQLQAATTADERRYWQHQIDRADSALIRWQAQVEKETR